MSGQGAANTNDGIKFFRSHAQNISVKHTVGLVSMVTDSGKVKEAGNFPCNGVTQAYERS